MWKDKFAEICKEAKSYDEEMNKGASEQEISILVDSIKEELNIDIPDGVISLLKIVNGLEFNGYILYGIDEDLLEDTPEQAINGLISNNLDWIYENEDLKKYLFIGDSSDSWYVFDTEASEYLILDKPSAVIIESFENIESMLDSILDEVLS